ncbi:hypothetical protein E2C01_068245 [Portunus trituberculatus]|uniref:Uncharacterized protein n=1 Tax=Portunus trituberculatus TaxID=210409 RepID=A0A5B7HV97_PORTR|nr:hypothetical protein [Portunus trituberculatus]
MTQADVEAVRAVRSGEVLTQRHQRDSTFHVLVHTLTASTPRPPPCQARRKGCGGGVALYGGGLEAYWGQGWREGAWVSMLVVGAVNILGRELQNTCFYHHVRSQ